MSNLNQRLKKMGNYASVLLVIIVVVGIGLRYLLMRKEDYYD